MPNTTDQNTSSSIDGGSVASTNVSFRELNTEIESAKSGSLKLGSTLTSALDSVISKGKSASTVVSGLADALSKAALKSALKPLEQISSGALDGLFSGGGGSTLPFASGGVFSGGLPIPFASGGVISSPVSFPLGNGQTGLAGERGPEAIMPLTRGTDGKLGIAGNSGGAATQVTFNVTSPDAESFSRSQTQIAAMLARTVSQGQRNL